MLRECQEHGYFRGAECPSCNEEGRFIMNERELDHIGRIMAGILRHFPEKFDLDMDDRGWVNVSDMVESVRERHERFHWLRPRHIHAIAATDPKGRYQIEGDEARATYGHSIEIHLDLPTNDVPQRLYYPVAEEELDIVLERGLTPTDRQRVHLSDSYESALQAGMRRAENPIILQVNSEMASQEGVRIMRAGKTVYLCDEVPPQYISQAK